MTVYDVIEKVSGKKRQCIAQMVELNLNSEYCLRYNIGIEGYHEWGFIECIYDNETFNKRYEVVGTHKSIMKER